MSDASEYKKAVILALSAIVKIGPVLVRNILNNAEDVAEIPAWSRARHLEIPGISDKLATEITSRLDMESALKIVDWAQQRDISLVTLLDEEYPRRLKEVYDAPPFLFIKGSFADDDSRSVAIVGSRNATEYGRSTAARVAGDLARNAVTVVSGMAVGIDSSAHRGALAGGGRTLAVLGSGVDVIYPPSNKNLYQEITENGAVISEFLPGNQPTPYNFPRRNRIISGMTMATIVVEAGVKSGALLTADMALSQGRKLLAVPGNLSSELSRGTNDLIKSGAELLTSTEDVFSILPELKKNYIMAEKRKTIDLTEGESLIYECLSDQPVQIDELVRKCGTSVRDISTFLLSLELRGLVKQLSGKRFITV